MVKLRLEDEALLKFKQVLEYVDYTFVHHAQIDCSSTSFSLQAMHSSERPLVKLLLNADYFQYYKCNTDISMRINFNIMKNLFKHVKKDDMFTFEASDELDSVNFEFRRTFEHEYFQMDFDIDHKHFWTIPKPDPYDAIVSMPSEKFSSICKDLSSVGDTVEITVKDKEEGITFHTKGKVRGETIVWKPNKVTVKPEDSRFITVIKRVSLVVALKYLNYFTKATPLCGTVTIHLSSALPSYVEYNIDKKGYIRFYVGLPMEDDGIKKVHEDTT